MGLGWRVAGRFAVHCGSGEQPYDMATWQLTAGVVVDGRLGEHGVVEDLTLLERRAVVRDQHDLRLAGAQRAEGLL